MDGYHQWAVGTTSGLCPSLHSFPAWCQGLSPLGSPGQWGLTPIFAFTKSLLHDRSCLIAEDETMSDE